MIHRETGQFRPSKSLWCDEEDSTFAPWLVCTTLNLSRPANQAYDMEVIDMLSRDRRGMIL